MTRGSSAFAASAFCDVFDATVEAAMIRSLSTGRYVAVNREFERVSGWPRERVLGKRAAELGLWIDAESFASERVTAEPSERDERLRTGEGRELVVRISLRSVEIGDERYEVSFLRETATGPSGERSPPGGAARLSHDIKNPLSVVLGFAQLLRSEAFDAAGLAEIADRIEAAAQSALSLALTFFDAERAESGALTVQRQKASVRAVVDVALKTLASRARLRAVELEHRCVAEPAEIVLDDALVERAIVTLVDNAIAASPRGARVEVETTASEGSVHVEVRDYGAAIPDDARALLFERQGASPPGRKTSGPGLYVVRTIAEAHGGNASARFPADGGAAFRISLPAA